MVVRHQGVRWTYSQLNERVDRLARALVASGLRRGDRLGIWSPNCAEWVLVQYASAKAGVILVNINPSYRSSELEYVLNQSGVRLLLAARAFKSSDFEQMVAEVTPRCSALERPVFLDSTDWDELLAAGDADVALPADLQFDDAVNIEYTSGTTGFPKGATLSHHNILNNGFFVAEACGYTTHGACMVVPAPSFDANTDATLRCVQDERCTSLYGVPTCWLKLNAPRVGVVWS